ncbi:hypothetical protein GGR55DRAFT_685317 [Xylaria sp. FL0064]|nr:hypothetical protein GGR55DRAFT_685317 [Xylaria sp. FL0064]
MDSVEKLFQGFPSPGFERALIKRNGVWDAFDFDRVFGSFSPHNSNDLDRYMIARWAQMVKQGITPTVLRSEIGQFALDKYQIPNNGSAKSKQLKYHAWISQGRKDEEYPFNDDDFSAARDGDLLKNSAGFLPNKLADSKICANCAKPNAKFSCSDCLLVQDSHVVMKTPYCNKACQFEHWKEHKSYCHARRKVCRAVSLLFDLFVMLEKKAWLRKLVSGVTEKQGITNIIQDWPDDWMYRGKPFVGPFPSVKAPSEEHALAALLASECQQPVTVFHNFVSVLFLPLCRELSEVQMAPRNAYRPTCIMRLHGVSNTMYNEHTVLRATLKSGEQMVVDICGAQFGWRETIAPWEVWTSYRSAGKTTVRPFGSTKKDMEKTFTAQFVRDSDYRRGLLAQKMQRGIQSENRGGLSVAELYKLDDATFASCKLAILSAAERALDDGVRELHESKMGRCYLDLCGNWLATTSKQQGEALAGVWLTDKDVEDAKRNGIDLSSLYKFRCSNPSNRQKFKAANLFMPWYGGGLFVNK